ncbi:CHAP domain-containing protein [Acetobacter fallax]|uniref:CHAP domain-containing protein n=1 Tax=Acetobacter fallax TaxID=1737473 RepID=A0ABX0KBR6_9PROT|nr:CHAP domain-containing protein [Acetobacter fallax]NHO33233.1 CHAP domain-containing protein [Acetobacter fallax]NHO36853.1 CHAP domain-containing protein [Acetobacter fallax]
MTACADGGGTGRSWHGRLQCAPWAREHSSIALRGQAASWWANARGEYPRASLPEPGSVLVFRATSRLPDGHVSVVRSVRGSRAILVDQANWNPGRIDHAVPVVDVSAGNDWTRVRVWWSPTGTMGRTVYSTYGFILPASHPGWIS